MTDVFHRIQQIDMPTAQALYQALKVLVTTPHVMEYLKANDPKALAQAEYACSLVEPKGGVKEERQPKLGEWVSYIDEAPSGAVRITSRITNHTWDAGTHNVRLESGVVLDRTLLVAEGPRYWQTLDSKRRYREQLQGRQP